MTTFEFLADRYPLHLQTILERIHECYAFRNMPRDIEEELARPEEGTVLITLFVWGDTPEGHGYWLALYVGAEGDPCTPIT